MERRTRLKEILLYLLGFGLVINTYFLYNFSNVANIVEPILIFAFLAFTIVTVLLHTSFDKPESKRNFLRLAFISMGTILIGSVLRRVLEALDGYIYNYLYLNTALYLIILLVVMWLAKDVFNEKVKDDEDEENLSFAQFMLF